MSDRHPTAEERCEYCDEGRSRDEHGWHTNKYTAHGWIRCKLWKPAELPTSKKRISDERLAALIQYGAPWGRWPEDEITAVLRELQERRATPETSWRCFHCARAEDDLET